MAQRLWQYPAKVEPLRQFVEGEAYAFGAWHPIAPSWVARSPRSADFPYFFWDSEVAIFRPERDFPLTIYPNKVFGPQRIHAGIQWYVLDPFAGIGAFDPSTMEWTQPVRQPYLLRRLHPAVLGWLAHQIEPSLFPIPELSWWQPTSSPERNWAQRRYAHAWRDPAFVNEWETVVNPPVAGTARLRTLVGVGV